MHESSFYANRKASTDKPKLEKHAIRLPGPSSSRESSSWPGLHSIPKDRKQELEKQKVSIETYF